MFHRWKVAVVDSIIFLVIILCLTSHGEAYFGHCVHQGPGTKQHLPVEESFTKGCLEQWRQDKGNQQGMVKHFRTSINREVSPLLDLKGQGGELLPEPWKRAIAERAALEKLNPTVVEWSLEEEGRMQTSHILSSHLLISSWCLPITKRNAPRWGPCGSAFTEPSRKGCSYIW